VDDMDCVYSVGWTEWENIGRFCYGNPKEKGRLQENVNVL